MTHVKTISRWIVSAILISLLLAPFQSIQAQSVKTITATGTMKVAGDDVNYLSVKFTFPPTGGAVSGSVYDERNDTNPDGTLCTAITKWTLNGTFAGGDGGSAQGTTTGTMEANNCGGSYPTFHYSGPWSGHFYANGTGSGVYDATVTAADQSSTGQFIWEVSFSADEFTSAVTQPVTADYIFATYGIRVVNSPAGDIYGQKSWTPHELQMMNDVLKELPPALLKNMAVTSIIRSQYDVDSNNKPDRGTMGFYAPFGDSGPIDKTGGSAVIEVFDSATKTNYFDSDPTGDTDFKGTILHELIHALQYHKDEYSVYDNAYKSPILQSYMDATTPLNAVDTGIWENGWTYFQTRGKGGSWKLWSDDNNKAPTHYGTTNPLEDMCESVKMYVYNPQKLKDSSPLRYNFIRENIFGGVEYADGIHR